MTKYIGPEFESCNRCPNPAGQLVAFHDDRPNEALCFSCWNPIKSTCKVLHWINKYGRIMFAPGDRAAPFRIKHP